MTEVNFKLQKKGNTSTVDVYVDGVQLFNPDPDGSFTVDIAPGEHKLELEVGTKDGDSATVTLTAKQKKIFSYTETMPPDLDDDWSPILSFTVP